MKSRWNQKVHARSQTKEPEEKKNIAFNVERKLSIFIFPSKKKKKFSYFFLPAIVLRI